MKLGEAVQYNESSYTKINIHASKKHIGFTEVKAKAMPALKCTGAKGCSCSACSMKAETVHGPTCPCKDCKEKYSK